MPLETFAGPAVESLLLQARMAFGPDALVLSMRTVPRADGPPQYQLLAADPRSAPQARKRMARDGGSHPSLKASPRPVDFAGARGEQVGQRVVAFVGPTGAGKTTTIAKLATHPEFFRGVPIGLLCLDTYRVGAVEQIRTYAEIAGLPLEVIYEPNDLPPALRRLADRALILVDTPGRGPRQQEDAQMIRRWLRQIRPHEVHLVIPTGLQPDLVNRLVASYRDWGVTHLLPTKVDESPDDWTLFDLAASARLPMRWLADGQEVPRDLKAAAPRLVSTVAALRSTPEPEPLAPVEVTQ